MLAALGLLQRNGCAARWRAREVGQLAHFLRCLLVIACQKRGASAYASPTLSSRLEARSAVNAGTHSSSFTERGEVGPRICAAAPLGGDDNLREARGSLHRFSLTLAVFGCKAPRPVAALNGWKNARPKKALTPAQRLAARLNAVMAAIENADACAERMARRIAELGLIVKRAAIERPENSFAAPAPNAAPRAPFHGVAQINSS